MLATLGGRPQGRDTKAELNRRSQACDVLTGTGISRRVNGGRVGALSRPDAAARRPYQKWTSIRVARPVFRFGRPACVSQHLCPGNGIPEESHQHVRFCKPPPGLLGQRDNRVKLRRPTKDQNLCRADLGSPADSSIRGLNRSRSPRCNACARESRAERGSLRPTHPDRKQTPA